MKGIRFNKVFVVSLTLLWLSFGLRAQSSDQSFPTPVTSSELSGVIKARDIGDARLTTYFYEFDGGQGDIFINVVTKNLSGDIDIYTADGLKPLTKMVVYADIGISETGRLVYLRKPERLILRVEGRTPGDEPATFKIKFAGSFIAMSPAKTVKEPKLDKTSAADDESGIKVNSVGTIISETPKQAPPKKSETEKPKQSQTVADVPKTKEKTGNSTKKPVVVIDDFPTSPVKIEPTKKPVVTRPSKPKITETDTAAKEDEPDPLASIRLVVQFKDGKVIERPMSEVLRFSVDKGILSVMLKDGKIARYSILLVTKITIE